MSAFRMRIVYWLIPLLALAVVSCSTGEPFSERESTEAPRVQPATLTQAPSPTLAPTDKPKIALSVLIENGGHGGSAAAPVAGELIKQFLGVNE